MKTFARREMVRRVRRLEALSLKRTLKTLSGRAGARCRLDRRSVVNFSSNDYLGLAGEPPAPGPLASAARRLGTGAGASRLVGGHHAVHAALERDFAALVGKPRAVCCPTGYQANVAALTALAVRGDTVFSDERNHASIVDGCRLSGARVVIYRHADAGALARALAAARPRGAAVVVTESIFSVDGDEAPLREIAALRREHGFLFVVDEAHAVGCYGPAGRGLCAEAGVSDDADVIVGTFGKAVGASGGALACSEEAADLVISRGRGFMFTTATPPIVAEMTRLALHRAIGADAARARLAGNVRRFRDLCRERGIGVGGTRAICPLFVGDERRTLALMDRLWDRGFYVQALRPPTVPKGTCRLRISISAAHRTRDLAGLADAIAEETGRLPAGGRRGGGNRR